MLTRPVKLPSGPSPALNNLGNVNLASLKRQVAFLPARWLHSAFVTYVVQFDDSRLLSFFIRGPRLSPVDRNSSLFSFQAQHLLKPGFKQLDCLFSFCLKFIIRIRDSSLQRDCAAYIIYSFLLVLFRIYISASQKAAGSAFWLALTYLQPWGKIMTNLHSYTNE